MRAMVVRAFGGPERIVLEERERPAPRPGEALVRVAACGVCHHDVLDRKGLLPSARLPQILGHEIAGTVERVGEGVDALAPGDPVAVYVRTARGRTAATPSTCSRRRTTCCPFRPPRRSWTRRWPPAPSGLACRHCAPRPW